MLSGYKALCYCCPGPGPCTPTETATACYAVVLNCQNQTHIFGPAGDQTITCSSYVCGGCFGFFGFVENHTQASSTAQCTFILQSTHYDVIVRGRHTTEEEIEDKLVSTYGPRLSHDEMKNVITVRVVNPNISLLRRSESCPHHRMQDSGTQLEVQRASEYSWTAEEL